MMKHPEFNFLKYQSRPGLDCVDWFEVWMKKKDEMFINTTPTHVEDDVYGY